MSRAAAGGGPGNDSTHGAAPSRPGCRGSAPGGRDALPGPAVGLPPRNRPAPNLAVGAPSRRGSPVRPCALCPVPLPGPFPCRPPQRRRWPRGRPRTARRALRTPRRHGRPGGTAACGRAGRERPGRHRHPYGGARGGWSGATRERRAEPGVTAAPGARSGAGSRCAPRGTPGRGPVPPPLPRRGPVPPRSLPRLLVGSARLAAVPRRAALLSARQRPGSGSALPPDRGAAGAALRPPAVCGCPATAGPGPPGAAPGRRQLAPGPRLKAQRRLGAEPPPGGAAEGGWGGHGGAVGTRAGTVRSERGNGRGGVRVRTGTAGP